MRRSLSPSRTRIIATAAAGVLALTGLAVSLGQSQDAAAADSTSPNWARLVDRVPAPVLHWTICQKTAQCATAELPLN